MEELRVGRPPSGNDEMPLGGGKKDPMMSEYPPGEGPPADAIMEELPVGRPPSGNDEMPLGGGKKDPMMSEYPPG